MSAERELLELAAKAMGDHPWLIPYKEEWLTCDEAWNPLTDDGDRLRLARRLGINIDFADCCAWKRLSDGGLYQEFWGGDCGDEAHAIVGIAAHIGRQLP